ncbi:MAG: hypothetical protein EP297_09055 [Gammaproteobacteria bacterium]|nr:MAG: hypothetical protein EP297_09055 [Gammaproteobacteria bacterium]
MTDFYSIPKHLPPRARATYDQGIPKIIWQTMKTNVVPKIMMDYSNSWIEQNPEYEYRFFDDEDITQFIAKEFPEYISAYKKIKHGAVKADFWRYLIMYKYGGVYADIDCRCIVPLRKWIQPTAKWVTQIGVNMDVCQWLIISIPGNPVFRKAAEKSCANLLNPKEYCQYKGFTLDDNHEVKLCKQVQPIRKYHSIMKLAGPPVLQEAAEECFLTPPDDAIFKSMQIVCVSDNAPCQMGGNVQHDYKNQEYLQGLEELSTPHYESSIRQAKTFSNFVKKILGRINNTILRAVRHINYYSAKEIEK